MQLPPHSFVIVKLMLLNADLTEAIRAESPPPPWTGSKGCCVFSELGAENGVLYAFDKRHRITKLRDHGQSC